MKKFTFLWAALILATMGLNAQNLIENPDFETWTAGTPDVWTFNDETMQLTENTAEYHTGTSSCSVLFTSQEQSQVNLLSNTFAVVAGSDFTANAWFKENDPAGRATVSVKFDVSNIYSEIYTADSAVWQELSFTSIVPDGATTAQLQIRFYDVSANWVDNCEILVDGAGFMMDNSIHPEPTNYPTVFAATANGVSANASWTDSDGEQLPQKYLVMASTSASFTAPVDGTPVANDADLSDGSAVVNAAYGTQSASFTGTEPNATYYFTIFPYNNDGGDIDYKTDASAPTTELTMPDVSVLTFVDFEDETFGDWTPINVNGDQEWYTFEFGDAKFAVMSGYDGGPVANEDWVVSPILNTENYSNVKFSFSNAVSFNGPDLQVFLSQDYDGSADPNNFTWVEITSEFEFSESDFNWVESGAANLDQYSHATLSLGFKYFSSPNDGAKKWEIDNLFVSGVMSNSTIEKQISELSVYPNPSNGLYQINNTNQTELNISVYNVLGKLVYETISAEQLVTLDIQNQNNGVYLVQLTGQGNTKTISVIKK